MGMILQHWRQAQGGISAFARFAVAVVLLFSCSATARAQALSVSPPSFANISADGAARSFAITTSRPWTVTSDAEWISITSGMSGTGAGVVLFRVLPNITGDPRSATISVRTDDATTFKVPVTQGGKLFATPWSLTFTYLNQGSLPRPQTIFVDSSGHRDAVAHGTAATESGGQWLSVTGGGRVPTTLTVSVSPQGLQAGTYHGEIEIDADGYNGVDVPVTLTVTAPANLNATPNQMSFQFQTNGPPPNSQQLTLTSTTSNQLPYSVSVAPGASWLHANGSGQTPGSVTVSVAPGNLSAGTYNGTVKVTSAEASNSPVSVPVTLVVSPTPELKAAPPSVAFQHRQNTPAPPKTDVNITSTGGQVDVATSTSPGAPWLHATGSGRTPLTISISADPVSLPGSYQGTVTVIPLQPTVTPLTISVTLTETAAPSFGASPQQVSFHAYLGSSDPPAQSVSLSTTNATPISFTTAATTSSGGNWLAVQPLVGSAPGVLTVSARTGNPQLPVGVYHGAVTVTSTEAANSPFSIPATLTVDPPPALEASPASLSYSYRLLSPNLPAEQSALVTTSDSSTALVTATASDPWLTVTGGGATPATLRINVKPAGLSPGAYTGRVTITANGYQTGTIPVSFSVTPAPVISSIPGDLTFAYQQKGTVPPPQTVAVNSDPSGIPFTVSASAPWLHVSGGGSTNSSILVSVDPTGLSIGSYQGFVNITSSQASNSPDVVEVKLNVTSAPAISASPAAVKFLYTQQGTAPLPQTIAIGSPKPLAFTASVAPGAPWLHVVGGGTTPSNLTASVDTTGLAVGDHVGSIIVDAPGASNTPLTIPVTLTVAAAPFLQANPSHLTFSYQLTKGAPTAQLLTITSSGAPVVVSAATSGDSWLQISGSGGPTPATFTVTADGSKLAAGTYQASVIVTSAGAGNSPLTVPVTLLVTGKPVLKVSPTRLSFSYAIGAASPPNQQVVVSSSAEALTFTVAASTDSGGLWLSAQSDGKTPTTVDIKVDPSTLAAGTYTGKVTLTSAGAGNSPLEIPVTLVVTGAVTLTALPSHLNFTYEPPGSTPPAQEVRIQSNGAEVPFTASVAPGALWLSVTGNSTTPGVLTVAVNPAGLAGGDYAGTVVVTSDAAANNPLEIPVLFRVVPAASLIVTPKILLFAYVAPTGPLPAPKTLNVTSSGPPISYTASASTDAPWIHVSGSGTTPGTIQVTVDPTGLSVGPHAGTVVISAPSVDSYESVNVVLTVTPAASLVASPSQMSFLYQGGLPPSPQTLTITSSTSNTLAFSASTSSNAPWLAVSGSGSTPGAVTVSVQPGTLALGTYQASVVVTSNDAGNSPLLVPVSFTLSEAPLLSAAPASLAFQHRAQTPAPPKSTINITSTGGPVDVTVSTSAKATWLHATAGGRTPFTIEVSVDPTGVPPGRFPGTVNVIPVAGSGVVPLLIPVTLTETAAPSFTATPSSVSFKVNAGSADPPAQTLALSTTSQISLTFSAAASTTSGGNWLAVQPSSGTTPSNLTVSAHLGSLAVGVYQGTVTVTSSEAGNSPYTIPASLTVETPPALNARPQDLSFAYQSFSPALPPDQDIVVTTSNASIATGITAIASTPTGHWLSVSPPPSGPTPATLRVRVDPAGLTAGSYSGTVTISADGYQQTIVSVSLSITPAPVITLSPSSLAFAHQQGGSVPLPQTVSVNSTSPGLPYSVSVSDPWIHASGGGSTNGSVSVAVDPAGLAPGLHRGSVSITSSQAGNSPVLASVELNISPATAVAASPPSLHFKYTQLGPVPGSQPVSITSTNPINFTTSVSPAGEWLSVTDGGSTPFIITVTVNPTGLAAGEYQGLVLIQAPGAANNPLSIPVTVTVTEAPALKSDPAQLVFSQQLTRGAPTAQTLTITSSGVPVNVLATTSGEPWLSIAGTGGTTPAVFLVSVDGSKLAAGTYQGTVMVTSPAASNSPLNVSVTLIVTAKPVLKTAPDQVHFSSQIGQASPANQQVLVSSSAEALDYDVTVATDSGGPWLSAVGGKTTPSAVDIKADPSGMAAGTYTGKVTLTSGAAGNSPMNIPVTFVVTDAVTLTAAPANLSFTYVTSGSLPPSQQVRVTSSGAQIAFAASVAAGASWLAVSGDSVTPGVLTVTLSPTSLAPGDYAGTIVIRSDAAANNPLEVPVSLRVVTATSLQVSPKTLRFAYLLQGSVPPPQTLSVTSSAAPITFQTTVSPRAPWLHVNDGGTTPGTLTVSVDPAGLAVRDYVGTILVASTAGNSFETVLVMLSVSTLPNLSTSPASLNFNYQINGSPALTQSLLVLSDSGSPSVAVSVNTFSGGAWLSAGGSGNPPFQVPVSVNPTGLGPGVYDGQVILTSSGAANSPFAVPVTFTVSVAPVLSSGPTSLTFAHTVGENSPPPDQFVNVTSGTPVSVTVFASTSEGVPWLTATSVSSKTPLTITASVNPTGLSSGNHSGTISVSSAEAGNSPLIIPVAFKVSAQPVLRALPSSASFAYTLGGPSPAPLDVRIESTQTVNVSASVSPPSVWLAVSGGGTTPATLHLTVSPVGLEPGTYTSSVLVTSPGAANSPISIPVTLVVVANAPVLTTSPSALLLQAENGQAVTAPLQVLSTGAPVAFTTISSPNSPWLTALSSGTTPQTINIKASASGLAPGTYSGAVIVTSAGVANSPVRVPVTFEVLGTAAITVSPETISFTAQSGGASQSQTVTVLLNGQPATNHDTLPLRPSPWMSVQSAGGGKFIVTANPSAVDPGSYLAGVAVTEPTASNSPVLVPVQLKVAGVPVEPSGTSVALASATGSNTPTSETIHIGGGPADFSVEITGGTWLKVSPPSGRIPVDLALTADPTGLTPGTYTGTTTLHVKGAADQIYEVVLGVGDPGMLVASPQQLTFRYNHNDAAAPPSQSVALASVSPGFAFQAATAAPWLSADVFAGTTPSRLSVSVNPASLAPGVYRSEITFTASSGGAPAGHIPVEFYVDQFAAPRVSSVSNGASFFFPAALAPGLIVSIFGRGLGASTPAVPTLTGGILPTSLGGTQVLVNGVPCPLLYVSDSQINAVVSFALDGSTGKNAKLVVRYQGVDSDSADSATDASAPGIFSGNSTGQGPGAILNLDNSVNTPANPANKGSFVALYAAGGGQTTPPGLDGSIYTAAGWSPQLPLSVQVGGIEAEVSYKGAAPGFVAGALQVNFKIPANAPTGEVPVVLKVGNGTSQPGLTISIR